MTSPMVRPVAQVVPEKQTFMISFSQTICFTSSKSATLKPDDRQVSAEASSSAIGKPSNAPKRIISMPL